MMPPGPPTSLPPGLVPPGPPPGPPPKEAFRFNAVGYNKTQEPMLNMQGNGPIVLYKRLFCPFVYTMQLWYKWTFNLLEETLKKIEIVKNITTA